MTDSAFELDPDNPGWIRGWGVVRMSPWALQGMYVTEAEAIAICAQHPGFEVKRGSRKLGSNDFVAG